MKRWSLGKKYKIVEKERERERKKCFFENDLKMMEVPKKKLFEKIENVIERSMKFNVS